MRTLLLFLLLAATAGPALPGTAEAQGSRDLLRSISQGGGWVAIPIEEGSGTYRTDTVPTLGLTLSGCIQVWAGHSGQWTIEARDPMNDGRVDATTRPGENVPFSYQTGSRSLLDVQVRWSEPRDTTLLLWVGLEGIMFRERGACTPVYGGG